MLHARRIFFFGDTVSHESGGGLGLPEENTPNPNSRTLGANLLSSGEVRRSGIGGAWF
jgi:hypothetical protein